MTQLSTVTEIRRIPNVSASFRDGEYRVIPTGVSPRAQENNAYYTDDPLDAVITAMDMSRRNTPVFGRLAA